MHALQTFQAEQTKPLLADDSGHDKEYRVDIQLDSEAGDASSARDQPSPRILAFVFWVTVNIAATIGIVFLNRAVLQLEHFKAAPTMFVAFHFGLTSLTLWTLSSETLSVFARKDIPWRPILPVCVVHGAATIITNASLTALEVPTYQLMRVLITPVTVGINFLVFRSLISFRAAGLLCLVCLGVAYMSISDAQEKARLAEGNMSLRRDTLLGYAFGLGGVTLAALYGIMIGQYHKTFEATSMQLLAVISPISCALLWALSPFTDTLPPWREVTLTEWSLVFGSGLCAVMINASQFCIIAQSSALSSTVVGHLKTCLIVALGWWLAHTHVTSSMGVGIAVALLGIFGYSALQIADSTRKALPAVQLPLTQSPQVESKS